MWRGVQSLLVEVSWWLPTAVFGIQWLYWSKKLFFQELYTNLQRMESIWEFLTPCPLPTLHSICLFEVCSYIDVLHAFLTLTLHYMEGLPQMDSSHSASQPVSMARMQMSSPLNSRSTLWLQCVGHNPPTDVNNCFRSACAVDMKSLNNADGFSQ